MTSVSTRPRATAPPSSRILTRAFEIALVGGVGKIDDHGARQSGTTPRAAVAVRAARRRTAGPQVPAACTAPGWPTCVGPVLLDRVEDLPAELDLLVPREQRRVAEQHVEDQALVGLGARLGEGVAVAEVHRDVAHLHPGARHLRAEPDRDALVGLHADDERVLAEAPRSALSREQVLRARA